MTSHPNPYSVLAYYHFVDIADPHLEVEIHKAFLQQRDVTSRIYISAQGINGQMCAANEDAKAYIEWMHRRALFSDVVFKIHYSHEQVFPKQTVKYRKQLVAFDADVDLSKRGKHVSPKQWKEMLEAENKPILIDVRNSYEWKVGYFEGAELPPCETFREFDDYANGLKERVGASSTPVMMYCTGGIRCELYSSILKDKGFENVFQLDGGVINYGLQEGSTHWLGKLFVFDDRFTVPISDEETPVVGQCHHCQSPTESYYNCANMDCNELFLCCQECLKKFGGCCQDSCQHSERVRPYHEQNPHKPFRKRYTYNMPKKGQC